MWRILEFLKIKLYIFKIWLYTFFMSADYKRGSFEIIRIIKGRKVWIKWENKLIPEEFIIPWRCFLI